MIRNRATTTAKGLLARLRQDTGGNTLALIAAGLVPLLALVGGGIDMGRSYLSQTRLQQACDAGVLAARKKLGSAVVADGNVPADVATIGNRFFNLNFRDGSYGTDNRDFEMTLEEDYAISGAATVDVPTTIMTLFGYTQMPISVSCEANLNFSNTDIMFVLDTTGSMKQTNPSDSEPKIDILRSVVRSFHNQLEGSKTPGTRVRYGFVPYSTNVNVGQILKDEWMVSNWTYQSRTNSQIVPEVGTDTDYENYSTPTGSYTPAVTESTYPATLHPAASETEPAYYSCDTADPADNYEDNYSQVGAPVVEPYVGPPTGEQTTQRWRRTQNGINYWTKLNGGTCEVRREEYVDYAYEYDEITKPDLGSKQYYLYAPISRSVASWRTESNGCIEERATYQIDDWDNVDFTRALDLDIDSVPTTGNSDTQWRPMYPDIIYEREMDYYGSSGSFNVAPVISDYDHFFKPTRVDSLVACPNVSRKLAEMNSSDVNSYLASITPRGYTYHDIGMIWGGRLLSPTGLFAAENADVNGRPTGRHLIFLTDGETMAVDLAYGSYGVEPLDQRRWDPTSGLSLKETVEKRFTVACDEVKKRNITVWVIGFGVGLDEFMTKCAGTGRHFEAADADELQEVFSNIASQMGDLRISK